MVPTGGLGGIDQVVSRNSGLDDFERAGVHAGKLGCPLDAFCGNGVDPSPRPACLSSVPSSAGLYFWAYMFRLRESVSGIGSFENVSPTFAVPFSGLLGAFREFCDRRVRLFGLALPLSQLHFPKCV